MPRVLKLSNTSTNKKRYNGAQLAPPRKKGMTVSKNELAHSLFIITNNHWSNSTNLSQNFTAKKFIAAKVTHAS